ncbi:phosphatidylinositol 4-phosphate 5-kinase type-1 alpha-like [Acyrthosiphon pisum]|uniref:PIPK domain-containing protein n=1 Tax=Acyrthosiphon pisum TaxID=7029 RepID=A0A8R2JWG1_ACYPI|nr:phosphatidylinositol 4-phosphate 5-kinase type-1 alpha-like [Acyrthosiphon pisum]
MKTVEKTENKCLLKLLSSYSTYLSDNKESLLPKFSGFYGFKSKAIDIKLVSMNNLLPSNIKMHQRFDLKDFICELHPKGIFVKPEIRLALLETIERDCKILKDINIMDYSLLMGIHNIDHPLKIDDDISSNTYTLRLAAKAWWESLMNDSVEEKSIQSDVGTLSDENYASLKRSIPAKSVNGDRLLLFVGIIDILQTYGKTKSLERSLKSLKLKFTCLSATKSADSISVQPPEFYASRFLKYMTDSVFKPMLSPQELDELYKQPINMLSHC